MSPLVQEIQTKEEMEKNDRQEEQGEQQPEDNGKETLTAQCYVN